MRAAWISVCFPPPPSPGEWFLSGSDSFLSLWFILITALSYGDRNLGLHQVSRSGPFRLVTTDPVLFTSHAHILLLAEMPCLPTAILNIITSDTWTFPQGSHTSQSSGSQQGSQSVPYSVSPVAISPFCSLDQRALRSCFLHQCLPLAVFKFPNTWQPAEKSDYWIRDVPCFHWFLSVSYSPYSWLISRKRAFSLPSWSRNSGKDYFKMIEDLNR